MRKACLFLLAGLYAPQLSSFASYSDLFSLLAFATVTAIVTGRLSVVCFTATGYAAFIFASNLVIDSRIDPANVGDSIMADVRITDFPQRRQDTISFTGEVSGNRWVPDRIRVSWFDSGETIRIGEVWRLELRLRRPRGNSNPGVFDYEAWLFRNRIAATAYVVEGERNRRLQSQGSGPVDSLRARLVARLQAAVEDPERAAVLAAISVGARHLVTEDQWDRYAMSGTSHLMAISGLHVGMVVATGYFVASVLAGVLRLRVNLHFLSTMVALAFATAYAFMSGLAVPAQRAVLMVGLSAIAVLRNRIVRPFTVIAAACLLLSTASPLATLEPGFRLSFAAVVILVWIARRLVPGSGPVTRPFRAAHLLAAAQFALLLGLLPLTTLEFGRSALIAPVVNLLAVPIFSLATVPLTFFGLLLDGPLEGIGNFALRTAASSLGIVEWVIKRALELPGAAVRIPQMGGWSLAMLWVSTTWVALPPGWPGRNVAWISLLFVVLYEPLRPLPGCARLDVLDVGQGLAIVVSTRSSTLLFDTGPAYRSGGSAAESVILPFLANRKVGVIDHLVISHADVDHAGGVERILAKLRVERLYVGEPLNSGIPGIPCRSGDAWTSDGVSFDILYPPVGRQADGNDASCVLQVSAGSHRLLLTGDIEDRGESHLQRSGMLRSTAVVVVPHHGSRTSSQPLFVASLRPDLAIISAGYDNRWGHPDEEITARWRAAGSTVLNTALTGAISLTACSDTGIHSLSGHREQMRRIWHE